jgi:uncharacterized protein (TIGR02466 family)|tara:strand:- start:4161 stop:4817 length:657 start_codon:yes stop_codon:yes gene_type:complete
MEVNDNSNSKYFDNTMLLFATPIYICRDYSSEEYGIHETYAEQANVKLNLGQNFSSIETNILDLPHYSEIKNRIMHGLSEYTSNLLCITDQHEFYITQSWLNVNPPNTTHHRHNHTNALVSGVYYIDTIENDNITFSTQNTTTITNNPTLELKVNQFNLANSNSWQLPVNNNEIVFFPSTTYHQVATNTSTKNRISLSFNCFVKGPLGNKETMTGLQL